MATTNTPSSSIEKKTLKIDIVSDNVFRRQASHGIGAEETAGRLGVDKMEHYYQKFGKERVDKMIPYMKEQGSKVGIKFSYKGKVGNTMDSHRLLYFARDNGKQDEMIEKLMSYYFEQEKDISDSKVLEAAASEIGLKDAKEFLATDKLKDEVVADVDEVRQMGISGVPAFIINGEELLSGAQETKTWVDILIERGYIQKK